MTLTAPKSRQGKFVLVLAFLATVVAVVGLLLWASIAQAQLPNTTTELDQDPDGPAAIAPGAAVSYDAIATTTTTVPGGDTLVIEIELPPNLTTPVVTCVPAETNKNTTTDATCTWDGAVAATYTATLSGTAGGDLPVPTSLVCAVLIGVDDCDNLAAQVETATVVATITTAGNAKVTVTAAGMTGSPKTITAAVIVGDDASDVALAMRTALAADTDVTAMFAVTGATDKIILTRLTVEPDDVTLNIATDNDTSVGVTAAATSADTTSGGGDDAESVLDNVADTGLLTMSAAVTVPDATNFPGEAHIFLFSLAIGVTCENDTTDNDLVDCVGADVVVGGTDVCTASAPTVAAPGLDSATVVSVAITGGTGVDLLTCTVALDTKFVGADEGLTADDDFDITAVTATKTFDVTEAAGEIRHLDPADAATEDAAGTGDSDPQEDWCLAGTVSGTCGILVPQDDSDDATGSFHEACIINGSLTHTDDSGFITWSIVAVAGDPLPTAVSITEVAGPHDTAEPCVRWSTGFTGVQNITAVYDNGTGPAITYYWDGYCVEGGDCTAVDDADDAATGADPDDDPIPLPLVKEWNDIDETKIVAATGVAGDTLAANTLGMGGAAADWGNRDCSTDPVDAGYCTNANLDGLTLAQEATIYVQTPQLFITAPAVSFIDYTLGDHDAGQGGSYDGPVDGAEQTYTISGDCGSVRLEDPQSGAVIKLLQGGAAVTVLTSDKGVGFTFVPNDDGEITTIQANADCGPNAEICIGIATEEDNLFHSGPLDDAAAESICVTYTIGPPTSKTPQLAWAGQRVVVEHFWGSVDAAGDLVCPYGDTEFYVLYSVQAGPGSFTAALDGTLKDSSQSGQDVIVEVANDPAADTPNSGCISRVIFENQDQAQNDIIAYVVDGVDLSTATPVSQQVAFVIYYMKFEDATLTLVPGSRANHNSGAFTPNNPLDSSDDVTAMTGVNVSADVLARLRVRGWVETTNCPVRDSGTGAGGEFLPANRCIFPDDWRFKAGGGVGDSLNTAATVAGFAEESRPNFDIAGVTPAAPANQAPCNAAPRASGPFSWLDTNIQGDITVAPCGDSLAPNVATGNACLYAAVLYSCREVVFPNGVINAFDAPMPPALARFTLSGSGFLRPADKDSVYSTGNLFYTTHIPAEPWIAPINNDLSGYMWNTWGAPGAKAGQYDFWTDLADSSAEIVSCAGSDPSTTSPVFYDPLVTDPCGDGSGVRTGGYAWTKVYTDNHGEAMTWINGDAHLAFTDCESAAASAGHKIVLLSGWYCEEADVVGTSTLIASVDYPDKRKHFAIQSGEVTIEWTWGGVKDVTIEPGESAQFNYVVFHVTDRDGYCNSTTSLHPVLGEQVVFLIDSSAGTIFANINGDPAALLGTWTTKTADVTTFDAGASATIALGGLKVLPLLHNATDDTDDECQAWIHITESLLGPVNVIVTAYDPEGTVTFDIIVNEPTPTPVPETPTPTPANQGNLWADIDCSTGVNPVDSLKMLRADAGLSVAQGADCPAPSTAMNVIWDSQSTNEKWGDADCNGSVDPVDSLKVLRFDAGLFYIQQEPCPDIGAEVLIPQQ